jgi:hypothetical protein
MTHEERYTKETGAPTRLPYHENWYEPEFVFWLIEHLKQYEAKDHRHLLQQADGRGNG